MKKSTLAIATILGLTSASASAFDYFFQTGRSMGYGSAGTTYAHWSSAANYNPALIGAAAGSDEDFFLVLNLRGQVVEQGDTIDTLDEFSEDVGEFDEFSDVDLLEGDIVLLQNNIDTANSMADAVDKLNGIGLNVGFGGNAGLGMAFEKFAVSFHTNTQLSFGGTAIVDQADTNLVRRISELGQVLLDDVRPLFDEKNRLQAEFDTAAATLQEFEDRLANDPASVTQQEIDAAEAARDSAQEAFDDAVVLADQAKSTEDGLVAEYGDIFDSETQSINFDTDDLKSNARFAAIGWAEAGMTVGSNWKLDSGRTLSIGTTLKAVRLEFYDYQSSAAGFDEDDIDGDDYRTSEDFITADIGAILTLDSADKWRVGVTVKNLSGTEVESNKTRFTEGQESLFFKVEPQVRVGTSYNGGWYRLAADIDVTESKGPHYADGTEFFQGTQYASIGAVINAWDFAELRAGYRHNLVEESEELEASSTEQGVVTLGVGLYLGPIQFDLGLQAASDSIGAGFQTMVTW